MHWKTAATLYLLAPMGVLWIAFAAVETARIVAAIREGRS
jgi:hypothetical protein